MTGTPGYWMHETSGVLAPAVQAYFDGVMSPAQIAAMRSYLRQWMDGPWKGPMIDVLRSQVDDLLTQEDIRRWLHRALEQDIDPL